MLPARQNVRFASGIETCAGWLYPSPRASKRTRSPTIVLGHGLGGVKEMRLDAYSERFQAAGYTCLAFDYRYFGGSTGSPRGLIDFWSQADDWSAALDYVCQLDIVDTSRIGIFGTSFGGGLAIVTAAKEKSRVSAAVAQCPFTSGISSALQTGYGPILKLSLLGLWDKLSSSGTSTVTVAIVGEPGETALMNAPDAIKGYRKLLPEEDWKRQMQSVPARIVLAMPFLCPGSYAKHVPCPIYFAVCGEDSVAPPGPTMTYVKEAPRGTVKLYDGAGHFDVYVGDWFERVIVDYIEFYNRVL